ncbi:glycosyltransferase [Steroidobacter sp. S1-65]|uniref:Glycosyltransferase n=1 Tax=Steroidobacter gossypii TaxID=2805490 RepID=A0ABS1X496_9GAMM|nr:glycosyltransferase [Steroidobacter gossypii]MBM0108044.1 glycosyltransferase [Steroidobacter gossypii]
MRRSDEIIFIGLSITSSWGNGHASTYRSLLRGLHRRGHKVLFLERDQPWYASNRDAPILPFCQSRLYADVDELRSRFTPRIRAAAAVIVGSYVDDGRNVCDWVLEHATGVKAFYDIDTPVTLARLRDDSCEYLAASQVPDFDLMLSFTGGPTLQRLERDFGAKCARPLYCSVDVDQHQPKDVRRDIELGYLGTYSDDRQPALEELLNEPARRMPKRRFAVVGAQYPPHIAWPKNVQRIDHMAPGSHAQFYGRQRFTLNLTRADMRKAGHSPSVRLFEAAACGTPIISDEWVGIDEVLEPGKEILLASSTEDVTRYLDEVSDEQARQIAVAARERVCAEHSSVHRAEELERYLNAARGGPERRKVIGLGDAERAVAAP